MKILIADDDVELCQLLKEYLEQEGMTVQTVPDGHSAIEILNTQVFDILILDVMMPKLNGFDTLKELRTNSDIAVIMLTARGEKVDRITGLEMGADDYIAKPCDPRELIARIRAVTRRSLNIESNKSDSDVMQLDNVTVLKTSRQVMLADDYLELTSTEFDLLLVLIDKAGDLVSREELSQNGLGKQLKVYDRSIDVHVSNLRKKLGPDSQERERIKTVRGTGYQYVIYPDV
ncbi:response regulator transcription factor [Thalassotalea fonticola]|uniref:Response regulator transcription factor n=1 Tax=Thalassotalea fonticola TaxID=3065649 RepID=A0ABZ0GW91_9GAMM|nr:response regulator transcription factor [Colwelliaceae bacterium S1-1]